MTPFYDLNQFSHMPLVEGDHDQNHLHPFTQPNEHTSSIPCDPANYFNTPQVQGANNNDHDFLQQQALHQQEFIDHLLIQGSNNLPVSFSNNTNNIMEDQHKSSKWMSSKMRIMKKMMNPDGGIVTKNPRRCKQLLQDQQTQASNSNSNSPSDGVIRVCSDCNTTKTPLWRSGPSGPKSLCNACGIRQRKARRALAAAAAVSGALIPAVTQNKVRKEKESDAIDRSVPFKKRCRFSTAGGTAQKKLCFNDIVISLSKSSAFHRVFPQDEKDAAILLMALSCGLMCS